MIQHLQCRCGSSKAPCGCCEGIEAATPVAVANRPGLGALAYRVGTHSTFLETMLARLSTLCLGSEEECRANEGLRPLLKLTSRDTGDPSIALLDAWAIVADVLTFYQERIANEGYLRTATERRSMAAERDATDAHLLRRPPRQRPSSRPQLPTRCSPRATTPTRRARCGSSSRRSPAAAWRRSSTAPGCARCSPAAIPPPAHAMMLPNAYPGMVLSIQYDLREGLDRLPELVVELSR